MYRSQYQFAPGVSLIAKMQFDSSISNGNACEVEKKMDKVVSEKGNKNLSNNIIYLGDTANKEVESLVTGALEALKK